MTIKLGVFTDRNERQRIDERSCTSATLNEMHTYEVSHLIIGKIKGKLHLINVFTYCNEGQRIDEHSCTSATLSEMHTYGVSRLIVGQA